MKGYHSLPERIKNGQSRITARMLAAALAIYCMPQEFQIGNEIKAHITTESKDEKIIANALSRAYGVNVRVDCFGGISQTIISRVALGYTYTGLGHSSDIVHIPDQVCTGIEKFRTGDTTTGSTISAFIASHEGAHITYVTRDERQADCQGMSHFVAFAEAIGRPLQTLSAEPFIEIEPHAKVEVPDYYDASCYKALIQQLPR